jgi:hypothetical protein
VHCENVNFDLKTWGNKAQTTNYPFESDPTASQEEKEDFSALCKTQMIKFRGNTATQKKSFVNESI